MTIRNCADGNGSCGRCERPECEPGRTHTVEVLERATTLQALVTVAGPDLTACMAKAETDMSLLNLRTIKSETTPARAGGWVVVLVGER